MKPKILSLPSVDKNYRTDRSNSADLVNCQFLPREPKKASESRPKNERNFARVLVCPPAFPLSDVSPARAGGVAQNDQMRGRRAPGGAPGSTLSLAATIGH